MCTGASEHNNVAAARSCMREDGCERTPAAHSIHQDEAVLHNLQQLIGDLHPDTQAMFRDSLFRISRNVLAQMMGRGSVIYAANMDRAVADLLFNNMAVEEQAAGMQQSLLRSHVRVLNYSTASP